MLKVLADRRRRRPFNRPRALRALTEERGRRCRRRCSLAGTSGWPGLCVLRGRLSSLLLPLLLHLALRELPQLFIAPGAREALADRAGSLAERVPPSLAERGGRCWRGRCCRPARRWGVVRAQQWDGVRERRWASARARWYQGGARARRRCSPARRGGARARWGGVGAQRRGAGRWDGAGRWYGTRAQRPERLVARGRSVATP